MYEYVVYVYGFNACLAIWVYIFCWGIAVFLCVELTLDS